MNLTNTARFADYSFSWSTQIAERS